MQTEVRCEMEGDVGRLIFTCDEPGKPTTLDHAVLDALDAGIAEFEAQTGSLRAVVVQSAFPKYFLVGANIKELEHLSVETITRWVEHGHAVFNRLASLPLPVIARVAGYALGGGLELAMACDLIFATTGASFGQPEARLGLVSGWGGSYRLPRRVGLAQAKLLFFTGRIISADAALAMGLVDFVGADEDALDVYLQGFLTDLRLCSPLAVAEMKRLLNHSPDVALVINGQEEVWASQVCLASPETQARVASYLAGRKKRK